MRYLTAGESHGRCLVAIIEGMPSNVHISVDRINEELRKRQMGYGRGLRMKIESDEVRILSGIRNSKTTGAPISLMIENKDWPNWEKIMDPVVSSSERMVTRPRPGHADLSGAIKYGLKDIRDVLERSSARETAIRVAVGAVAMQLLEQFDIEVHSHVVSIGGIKCKETTDYSKCFWDIVERSEMFCADNEAEAKMRDLIDKAKAEGDSLGGVFEVVVTGLPIGIGSYVQWDRKLDARLAYALMSIQAVKGVEFGYGFKAAEMPGSMVHDEIYYSEEKGYYRVTNGAGGIEGGMTNGQPVVVRCAVKPIPTLYKPLKSVDMRTKQPVEASVERSDVCAVPAASIVGKAVVAWEIASALLERYGGDNIEDILRVYKEINSKKGY
ncbi:chorismate synthase [Caldanaerobius fijiensis DSM 17918]|uniref:Chorismate synthase n=1 Tax=Caldanaerobius fijiensis DSM 17918 TaxID=1121256 RepID=A0A1M4VJN1_9THEO|nr:chorismate synthase [Caldanaerobius fijiensis]SHE69184.1 chorismate synthase [Caldanaerobius fijiensis DSM 17918]